MGIEDVVEGKLKVKGGSGVWEGTEVEDVTAEKSLAGKGGEGF